MAPGTAAAEPSDSSTGSQTIIGNSMDDDTPDRCRSPTSRDDDQARITAFEPLRGGAPQARDAGQRTTSRNRPLSLRSSRSYGGEDGYGCMSEDAHVEIRENAESHDPEKEFEVRWDGDNDPMNPRSMSKPRKWLIVVIVSSCSLCVYVLGTPEDVESAD